MSPEMSSVTTDKHVFSVLSKQGRKRDRPLDSAAIWMSIATKCIFKLKKGVEISNGGDFFRSHARRPLIRLLLLPLRHLSFSPGIIIQPQREIRRHSLFQNKREIYGDNYDTSTLPSLP